MDYDYWTKFFKLPFLIVNTLKTFFLGAGHFFMTALKISRIHSAKIFLRLKKKI